MLKDIVAKYTISNEDAEEDKKLDEVADVEETEETKEAEETREDETQEEQSEEAEEAEADETNDDLAAEEEAGDTTVLEAPTDEQGEVTTVDAEEVVSEVTPEADVVEAGDDIGQETPEEAFDGISDKEDITAGSDEDIPLVAVGETDNKAVEEVVAAGKEVAEGQAQIIEQAEAAATAVENGTVPTDVNGNTITPEEEAVNVKEEQVAEEIEAQTAEEVTATDVTREETPLEEAEALADDLVEEVKEDAEESTDDSLGEDAATSDDGITDTDTGDSTSSDFGDESTEVVENDDDIPLEGAESNTEVPEETTELETEVSEEATDLPEGDAPDTEVTEGDTTDVQESVDDQNLAADLTAEAASADVNETEAIKGDNSVKDAIDTIPEDATADDSTTPETDPLDVDVDETFKDKEVDGNPSYSDNHQDDTAPTVQETIDNPDGTEESLAKDISDDAVTDNSDLEASVTEGDETDPTTVASDGIDEVEQTSQVGDNGEIEDITGEADFAEGEVDIPDVDPETTEDEVAEAAVVADDEDVKADYDEQLAIDASKTVEELQEEAKGLEAYIGLLETGIANESYTAATIVHGYPLLDKHQKLWQVNTNPSLEDYGPKDLDLLYVASLESARGFLSRVYTLTARLKTQLQKWWERPMVTKIVKRSDALQKAADKALVDVKASSFTGGEVKGISGYLSTDKVGLVRAVAEDLKYTTAIATKGLTGNEKLVHTLVKAIDDIVSAKTPEGIKSVLKAAKGIKSSKSSYPQEPFNKGALMGNWKLTTKEGSIGVSGIPVAVKETSGDRRTSFTLNKSDLASLLVMAKTYASIANKTAETVGNKAVDEYPSIDQARTRALPLLGTGRIFGDLNDEGEIDDLASDMVEASKAHHDAYKFIVKHALDMSEALIAVVNKAI